MEIEQKQQNKPKDFLSTKQMLLSTTIIIVEAILIFVIGYSVIDLSIEGELAVIFAIPLLLFEAAISIIGIIVGFLYLKKNKFNIIPVILIIFSIVALPFFGMKFKTSILEPMVRADIHNRYVKDSLNFQNEQKIRQ